MKGKARYFVGLLLIGLLGSIYFFTVKKQEKEITIGIFAESNWDVPSGTVYEILESAINKFEAEHKNVKVNYISGILKEDYSGWLSGQLLKGEEPDVFLILSEDFETFASLGILYDLQKLISRDKTFAQEDFYDAAYTCGQWRGKQFALPYESVPAIMFVNKTLLERENIPMPENDWTWEDFYEICEKVTKDTTDDGIIDQFGCYNYKWKHAAYANQCKIFNEEGSTCYLSRQNWEEAVQFMSDLNKLNHGYIVKSKDFDLGKVAFQPLLFSEYSTYMPYPWKIKKYTNFQWDCITLPAGPGGGNLSELDTLLMGISSRTGEKTLAWEFLKLMTCDPSVQTDIFRYSQGVSVLKSVTNSEEVEEMMKEKSMGGNNLNISLLNEIMETAVVTSKFQKYEEAMKLVDEGINEAIMGDRNIRTSLITLQRKVNTYLKN